MAQRVVWFKEPVAALADPAHFLAHVMTYGTVEDLRALQDLIGLDEFREVLDHAPPGIFDARSWTYWHLKCGRTPSPRATRCTARASAALAREHHQIARREPRASHAELPTEQGLGEQSGNAAYEQLEAIRYS